MAFIPNSQLFPMAFAQYEEFLRENTIVTGTPDAEMLNRVGWRLADAAHKWLNSQGAARELDNFAWEFTLIQDNSINAWAMPGGKIVFYTGILPVTKDETGIAIVMGHEIAHVLLNHGQARMSAGLLQELSVVGLSIGMGIGGLSSESQALWMTAFGVGSTLFGTLPYSRRHENEADRLGLILMAIAGYNPEEAAPFWERMSALGGASPPEFLSTHPSNATRIRNIRSLVPEAKQVAAGFGVRF